MNNKTIFVRFQKEGIHCFPQAEDDPALVDVRFLAYPHRHMFHIEVEIDVLHDDRDIEFILFKRWLEDKFSGEAFDMDYKSCEMIADLIYDMIVLEYPGRCVKIEVSEDNENGCRAYYPAPE